MTMPPLPPAGYRRPGYIYNADNEICGHALPILYYTADQMLEYGQACRAAALAELWQSVKPVAWRSWSDVHGLGFWETRKEAKLYDTGEGPEPLYLRPPQAKQVTCQIYGHVVGACAECNTHTEAQQVPMTDAEIDAITDVQWGHHTLPVYAAHRAFARAVEAHHNIKDAP